MPVAVRDDSPNAFRQMFELSRKQVRDFSEVMTDIAKTIVPVDTGNLKSSIDFREISTPRQVVFIVFTQTGYGAYVELGTSRMRAQPYLAPAFNRARAKILG